MGNWWQPNCKWTVHGCWWCIPQGSWGCLLGKVLGWRPLEMGLPWRHAWRRVALPLVYFLSREGKVLVNTVRWIWIFIQVFFSLEPELLFWNIFQTLLLWSLGRKNDKFVCRHNSVNKISVVQTGSLDRLTEKWYVQELMHWSSFRDYKFHLFRFIQLKHG